MALSVLAKLRGRWLREQNNEGGEGGGGERRPTPAELNAARNRERLERINQIGQGVDARRAREMSDVDGDRVVGRFQGGALDDSPEARERAALEQDDLAQQALDEQRQRDEEAAQLEADEARRLQEEGADPDSRSSQDDGQPPDSEGEGGSRNEPDEKVVDGVRYYRTIVSGQEKWLTLKQLREGVALGLTTEDTLRRAQEALASASRAPETPKAPAAKVDKKDLANIILAASMGDEEAVEKLASAISDRPGGVEPGEIDRLVAQRIATQRAVDRAESAQEDLLGNETLGPVFKMRLAAFAQANPNTRIEDAYRQVGTQMRKDFAAMISQRPGGKAPVPQNKTDRKRGIVTPPRSAGRQPPRQDDDREVPVGEQIDAIARSRGQPRAHRIRRS